MSSRKIFSVPLHTQLRNALVRRIVRGEWGPGGVLPNEYEIGREYNLSPGTVRKALESMERAQLIIRRQGRGTFVIDPQSSEVIRRHLRLLDRAGDPVLGDVGTSELVSGGASEMEAERLGLRPSDQVYRVRQTRNKCGAALAWEERVLPGNLFSGLEERSHRISTIAEFAFANGLLVGRGKERVCVANADQRVAGVLGVKVGTPVLHLDRVIDTIDEIPVEWRSAWYLPAGIVYEADLN